MQVKKSTFPYQLLYPISGGYVKEEILFFDIETTGLSANTSYVCLIGCAFYKDGSLNLIQWLSDSIMEEKELLTEFNRFSKNFRVLIHYNGAAFDLRFLDIRCQRHDLSPDFLSLDSIDLYKKILPFKKLLPVPNLKLKTIEQLFLMKRKDTLSGEKLIDCYSRYVGLYALKEKLNHDENGLAALSTKGHRMAGNDTCDSLLAAMLLHNEEDVTSLIALSSLLMLCDLSCGNFHVKGHKPGTDCERFYLSFPGSLPKDVTLSFMLPVYDALSIAVELSNNTGIVTVPVAAASFHYFFENYRDYYYLPVEDTAIHKSVGEFVDKKFRQNAKAENCYIKKEGKFLPQIKKIVTPWFADKLKDKVTWFEQENAAIEDAEQARIYVKHFF